MNHSPKGGNPKWQTDQRWTSAPRWKVKEHEISTEHGGLGVHEPWLVQVDVYLSDDTTDPPEFQIESCLPRVTHTVGNKNEEYLVFDNHWRPGFRILFQLHDMTNMDDPANGYRFPHQAKDAVWSQQGDKCPTEHCTPEVFVPVRVMEPDGTTLVVDFRNETNIGKFRYTLRVTKDDGQNFLELDPGGTGNNGSS
jgi:hypothetical protein